MPEARPAASSTELEEEHSELLDELRAVIPGAEVLFAFLLTASFTERFDRLNDRQRGVYLFVFLASGLALVLLLAPSVFHRVRFRQGDKEAMLRIANTEALVALGVMSISIPAAVFLVTDIVYGGRWALASGLVTLATTLGVWWSIPVRRRMADTGS